MDIDVVAQLRAAGCVFAEEEAALLREVSTDQATLADLTARRVAGEPLEYLVGFVELGGSRYSLQPGVFIPRQRSALLVTEAARVGGGLILDLCCGCGALGLAVRERIGGALVAADISAVAVECARRNGVEEAYVGDLFSPLPGTLRGSVGLLIANTPYVPSAAIADMPRESRDHEPPASVDGGADGLDLHRRVLADASAWLTSGGHLLTETSRTQAPALAQLARDAGLEPQLVTDDDLGATVLIARLRS
ncbi:MAG: putative protein N(5)-glutamine methyltransferase [Marmoricola sp.]